MNPVLILTHNCLEMTKRCVESVLRQDIPTEVCTIDNGSNDGTDLWSYKNAYRWASFNHNAGVSKGWNIGLQLLLEDFPRDHALCLNNDTVLPPYFYRELLSYDVPFVTGVSSNDPQLTEHPPARCALVGHPDFSAFLIRREAWEKIGPFDEGMKLYAQDCDYHVRACKAGVPLLAANLPFYHERSSTLRLASPEERQEIEMQANADREYFRRKWGFAVGSAEYQQATSSRSGTPVPFPGEIRNSEETHT